MTPITSVSFPIPKPYITRFFERKNVRIKPASGFQGIKHGHIKKIGEILQRLKGSGERNG